MNMKFLTMLLPLALLFTACDKDDDQPAEKPILSLLQLSSIQIDTVVAATDWVYGFKFRVKNDGFINQIGMKLPVTGSFNAILWNLDENLPSTPPPPCRQACTACRTTRHVQESCTGTTAGRGRPRRGRRG